MYMTSELQEVGQLRRYSDQAMGWIVMFENQSSQQILFSLLQNVYADSDAYPGAYSMGTRGSFSMDKMAGA
jgi:hypothetical protein